MFLFLIIADCFVNNVFRAERKPQGLKPRSQGFLCGTA